MPAKSVAQRNFMQLVRLCQDTGKCLDKKIKKAADNMSVKQARSFAKTTNDEIEGAKKEENTSDKNSTLLRFNEYLKLREKNKCTCPCKSCKVQKNCSKCEHKNCKFEGCTCH